MFQAIVAAPARRRPSGGGVLTTLRPTTDRSATRLLWPIDGNRVALADQVATEFLVADLAPQQSRMRIFQELNIDGLQQPMQRVGMR
jgi:hypothetical protein